MISERRTGCQCGNDVGDSTGGGNDGMVCVWGRCIVDNGGEGQVCAYHAYWLSSIDSKWLT